MFSELQSRRCAVPLANEESSWLKPPTACSISSGVMFLGSSLSFFSVEAGINAKVTKARRRTGKVLKFLSRDLAISFVSFVLTPGLLFKKLHCRPGATVAQCWVAPAQFLTKARDAIAFH